ncbi:MAG: DUF1801 domain-containing protein [Saprospiraceae bacterium]|nr:DUF1801 domain-containing protein [Saprospiraceae bacterium]
MSNDQQINDYIEALPDDKKNAFILLREAVKNNIPDGFEERMSYGMLGYVVPHDLYPKGYHCDPKLPLPFINLGCQKNHIALYHMGLYANKELYEWFTSEYPKYVSSKLDIGKSCIRFKKIEQIPLPLIEELVRKVSVNEWIETYTSAFVKK